MNGYFKALELCKVRGMYQLFLWVGYSERKCLISVKTSEYKDVISPSYLSDLLSATQRRCWKPRTQVARPCPKESLRGREERAGADGQAGGASGRQEGAPPLGGGEVWDGTLLSALDLSDTS